MLTGEFEEGQRSVGGHELLHKNNMQPVKACLCAQESKRGRKSWSFPFTPALSNLLLMGSLEGAGRR